MHIRLLLYGIRPPEFPAAFTNRYKASGALRFRGRIVLRGESVAGCRMKPAWDDALYVACVESLELSGRVLIRETRWRNSGSVLGLARLVSCAANCNPPRKRSVPTVNPKNPPGRTRVCSPYVHWFHDSSVDVSTAATLRWFTITGEKCGCMFSNTGNVLKRGAVVCGPVLSKDGLMSC